MDRIRYFADVSVKRAVSFGLLGIFTVFIGLSHDWLLAFRAAAILLSLLAVVLLHCAWRAPRKDYRRREVWLLLDQWHGLPEHRAHHTISARDLPALCRARRLGRRGAMDDHVFGQPDAGAGAAAIVSPGDRRRPSLTTPVRSSPG